MGQRLKLIKMEQIVEQIGHISYLLLNVAL